ncbi:MAG: hypothetical protein L0Y58_01775 [Verrucomicrobia subdivision 3 bacterium]|nr:hypothetical protein [Limisphaerales bacterium]
MNIDLRNITNHYQDVKLISLSTWRQANEITPRDRNGPYVVMQEGYDPEDTRLIPEEFVLGRSGKWLSLGHFFQMPVPDRRAEFVFGTVGEIIQMMNNLPSKAEFLRPAGKEAPAPSAPAAGDEMAGAFQAARTKQTGETK